MIFCKRPRGERLWKWTRFWLMVWPGGVLLIVLAFIGAGILSMPLFFGVAAVAYGPTVLAYAVLTDIAPEIHHDIAILFAATQALAFWWIGALMLENCRDTGLAPELCLPLFSIVCALIAMAL